MGAAIAHTVDITIISHPLSREESGVEFKVEDSDGKLGELLISKGGIRWKPRRQRDHHFIGWKNLDELMREQPKK